METHTPIFPVPSLSVSLSASAVNEAFETSQIRGNQKQTSPRKNTKPTRKNASAVDSLAHLLCRPNIDAHRHGFVRPEAHS
jgi:hypothetical protein